MVYESPLSRLSQDDVPIGVNEVFLGPNISRALPRKRQEASLRLILHWHAE